MSFAIFDLDGTLADLDHRLHLIQTKPKNWTEFFAACGADSIVVPVRSLLHALVKAEWRVEIWSARSDEVREETEKWLQKHQIDPILLTRMRPAGNYIQDHVLKKSWLDDEPRMPTVIFDDRQRIVDMWRAEGILCCQVAAWSEDE